MNCMLEKERREEVELGEVMEDEERRVESLYLEGEGLERKRRRRVRSDEGQRVKGRCFKRERERRLRSSQI